MAVGKTVQAFQADLRKVSEDLEIDFGVVVRKTVFDLHRTVTEISPVDTGRFRASWGIAEFQIPDDPGADEHTNPHRGADGLTQNPMSEALQRERINADFREPYAVYFIYNNLPYAEPLEEGHSQQAPSGILDLALATVEAEIDSVLADVLR